MKVNSLVFSSSEFQLGDAGTGTLLVSNEGKGAGTATVQLQTDGRVLGQQPVSLGPGATQTVSIPFTTWGAGTFTVQALLDGQSKIVASLTVRAPALANAQSTHQDLTCKDHVPLHLTFQNGGDGVARNVMVAATIYNTNNVAQDSKQAAVGSVPAGGSGQADFDLFAPDTCGRDDYYHVTYVITPQYGEALTATTPPFSL
ncbi:MAG TPA: CARDB domain-containing protein [Candidatus Thermoplasmatota archaeon]|nr:CARDB domain-containing protein [Candidatus Thermoplasmatota archaeon]